MGIGKSFTDQEAMVLEEIICSRRDVRGNRFLPEEIDDQLLDKLLSAALHAPSVGFSQPWEFVVIRDKDIKSRIKTSFQEENDKALEHFTDARQDQYARLKLEGITEAPLNMAVFYKPSAKPVLGQTSMKEVGLYSVVCAVQNIWLMARALNIGMGWVSILNPDRVKEILHAPAENQLVAYLCIGWVDQFLSRPELEELDWEKRKLKESVVFYDQYR